MKERGDSWFELFYYCVLTFFVETIEAWQRHPVLMLMFFVLVLFGAVCLMFGYVVDFFILSVFSGVLWALAVYDYLVVRWVVMAKRYLGEKREMVIGWAEDWRSKNGK